MSDFKLTVEEAALLERIADATKMDGWFYIDPDLHVHDIEENNVISDAEGVCLLEDGLAYGLDEPQSGGLSSEEIKIVEACFKRARVTLLREKVSKQEDVTACVALYLDLYEDTDVVHRDVVENTIEELRDGDEENNMEAGKLELMLKDNPEVTYFNYYEEKPIDFEWLRDKLEMLDKHQKAAPKKGHNMSDCKIKLGTVGSRNKALRARTNGGTVYISESFLTPLAEQRPEDYLFCLEAAAKMIRQGPAFCLDKRRGILMLGTVDAQYREGSGFRLTVASATLSRDPNGKDWNLTSLDVNEGPMPDNPPKNLWIKLTPESMASREDWESVCELANVVPEDAASVTLHVSKAEWEERQ